MGYRALLFSADERLARIVGQLFAELEFSVDAAIEPFAAVKKLMTQPYDAIVVDCGHEQNASLLLKSARNSSSNESSLAIAMVEGQAGVAKAYRIGANLVLTKPINVEQARGTLRVARSLLRKTADAAAAARGLDAEPTGQNSGAAVGFASAVSAAAVAPAREITAVAVAESTASASAPPSAPAPAAEGPAAQSLMVTVEAHAPNLEVKEEAVPEAAFETVPTRSRGFKKVLYAMLIVLAVAAIGCSAYFAYERFIKTRANPVPSPADNIRIGTNGPLPLASPYPDPASSPSPALTALPDRDQDRNQGATDSPAQTPTPAPAGTSPGVVKSGGEGAADAALGGVKGNAAGNVASHAADHAVPRIAITSESTARQTPRVIRVKSDAEGMSQAGAGDPPPGVLTGTLMTPPGSLPANDGTLTGLIATPSSVAQPALARMRVSQGVSQGLLIKRVQPRYPKAALAYGGQGAVQIEATVTKEGKVVNPRVLSGDIVLAHAALEAVQQWRYKPYYLDGAPVEIQTQITITFKAN